MVEAVQPDVPPPCGPSRRRIRGKAFVSHDVDGRKFQSSKCITHSPAAVAFPKEGDEDFQAIPQKYCERIDRFMEQDKAAGKCAEQSWGTLLHESLPEFVGSDVAYILKNLVRRALRNRKALPKESLTCLVEFFAGSGQLAKVRRAMLGQAKRRSLFRPFLHFRPKPIQIDLRFSTEHDLTRPRPLAR